MTMYDRIRERRIELGMTQDDLAKAVGYKDRSMITKIEAGSVDLSQTKVAKFAEVLNVTDAYLMGWEEKAVLDLNPPVQFVPFGVSSKEELENRVCVDPKEDEEMATLWRRASLTAKRTAIYVLKSFEEEELNG